MRLTRRKINLPECALALALLAAQPARAVEAQIYHIPPQRLDKALTGFADSNNLKLMYDAGLTKGLKTQGVNGTMGRDAALRKLLEGTGLEYRYSGPDTITLIKPAPQQPTSPSPKSQSAPVPAGADTLPVVTVTGTQRGGFNPRNPFDRNYAVTDSVAATKTDTPIMQTPASIQAVSRPLMDDQQVVTLNDALKNVSGVQTADAFYEGALIRGFDIDGSTYRNGLRQAYITNLETANLSKVEVLKGPASVLYGRIQPGGMVNLVPKRALSETYFSVQQQFGSYDFYRTTVDATGPLLADKSLLGRMNIAYRNNNSFRDFVSQENVLVAPSLTWRPSDDFEANLDIEYQHYTFTDDEGGLVAVGNRPANIPISRYLQDENYTNSLHPNTQDKTLVAFDWTYHFNENWRLTNRFQYTSTFYQQTALWFGDLDETTGQLNRGIWATPLRRNSYATNLDLVGHFDTGSIAHHEVLLGFDFYRMDEHSGPGYTTGIYGPPNSINIYQPVYSGTDLIRAIPGGFDFAYERYENWYGFYFQDQITLWDKLHLLFGGRQDWASQSSGETSTGQFSDIRLNSISNNKFNPRVGILYQPAQWLSLYGNYVESYGSLNSARSISGQPFAPETGRQLEVGAKAESPDQRLIATMAFYQIYKQNLLATDPTNPLYSIPVGEARSQGFELDVMGKLTEEWSLTANYAYTEATITQGNNQGNWLMGVAKNAGNLWTKYEFSDGNLKGLSFGTGVYVRGQRQGDNENSFQLPGYARWDASLGYSFRQFGSKITTQLNVYNLLDKTYYDRSSWRLGINAGQPLTLLGSVRVEF